MPTPQRVLIYLRGSDPPLILCFPRKVSSAHAGTVFEALECTALDCEWNLVVEHVPHMCRPEVHLNTLLKTR